jgi:polysaccharide deacetylase 2 family uncharacterized protein YibQ
VLFSLNKLQISKTKKIGFVVLFFILSYSSQVYSLPKNSINKNLSFQDFLNLHYQSQITPLPVLQNHKQPVLDTLSTENINKKPRNHLSKLVIVIDDIGNNKSLDTRAAQLPGAVTIAILPHTPFSKSIAELAHANNKEIMLHAPMESLHDKPLGDGALTKDLSEEEFKNILQGNIDSIPHVVGLNNHMGSSLTQDEASMHLVMQTIQKNNLYFLDSKTTPRSVAAKLAQEYKISHVSRNIFLDNEETFEHIDAAFKSAIKISHKTGFAVVIGHPYPSTIKYLENALPELEKQGISLISLSELLIAQSEKNKNQQKELAKN